MDASAFWGRSPQNDQPHDSTHPMIHSTRNRSFIPPLRHTARALLAVAFGFACTPLKAERNYLAWFQAYDRTENATQRGVAVAMDANGNVFVTGYHDTGSADSWYTAKYDSLTGGLVWERTFAAAVGDARPAAIAVDAAGNPIVTGYTNTSSDGHDFQTIKYNGVTGSTAWSRTYANPQNGADEAIAIAVDASGNAVVTGRSQGSGTSTDIQTFKYAAANGADVWGADPRWSTPFVDEPRDVAVDPAGNVAVTGFSRVGSNRCFYTAKYNGATGALIWDETYDDAAGDDDAGTSVAMDAVGNVIVSGIVRNLDVTYSFHTIRYKSALNATQMDWQRTYDSPGGNAIDPSSPSPSLISPENFSPYLGVDGAGNAIIAGTSILDGFKTAFYVAKYAAASGAILWESQTAEIGGTNFVNDNVNALVVDGAGNAIVTGRSQNPEDGTDGAYYTVKFDGADGVILWQQLLNGARDKGNDEPFGVAVDLAGNVAVTGTARKAEPSAFSELLTVKYNRFIAYTGDAMPNDTGVPADAIYSTGNAPAISGSGVAAKITIADGRTKLSAIFTQGTAGGTTLPAVQRGDAPGITGAKWASFSDPIISPDGHHAFAAKVSGAPASQASGVWTNLGGTLHLALQKGKPVPGMTENLSSVLSLTLSNNQLLALVKVAAPASSNVALVAIDAMNAGTVVRRTGEAVTLDGTATTIKKLTVLSPPKTSPGDGRWHAGVTTVVKATLADKRTAIFHSTQNPGELVTGGPNFNPKTLGLPATDATGIRFAALVTQTVGGAVTTANDTILIRYSPNSQAYELIATEGDAPPSVAIAGPVFAAFSDPLIDFNNQALFLATLKGTGVTTKNNKALLYGSSGLQNLIARTGFPATDAAGLNGTAVWSSITNFVLPGGRPIFVAKLAGSGVSGKNNLGVWGVDSTGRVRRLLRTGDVLGDQTVKSFTLLKAVSTATSAARSFNSTGSITALVKFTNGKQALVAIGLP